MHFYATLFTPSSTSRLSARHRTVIRSATRTSHFLVGLLSTEHLVRSRIEIYTRFEFALRQIKELTKVIFRRIMNW